MTSIPADVDLLERELRALRPVPSPGGSLERVWACIQDQIRAERVSAWPQPAVGQNTGQDATLPEASKHSFLPDEGGVVAGLTGGGPTPRGEAA